MGKIQLCRICRTPKNLKFTVKQLREFNKSQLLSVQETQGSATDRASKKLLRTTPTLGNICYDCDDRIQIFHRLDDGNQSSGSDIEIDVVTSTNTTLPQAKLLPALNNNDRPETPVIVDDDDMLYNLFMQKVDQQRQQRQPQPITELPLNETSQPQQFISNFNPLYTPPQSNVGSEGDDAKIIEVLTSRESTPASIDTNVAPVPTGPSQTVDEHGHRIVAIIDLDDGDETTADNNDTINKETEVTPTKASIGLLQPSNNNLLNFIVASAKFQTEQINGGGILVTPSKNLKIPNQIRSVNATDDDDDEEIVFRRVEPHLETPPSKKKNRKSYDEKQLRLVASLSLVSSDSETEEPIKTPEKEPINRFTCTQCKVNFPDAESLRVHEQVHQGVKCPVCQFGYSQERRLIHHMRYKHRTYNGLELLEKPRASQDSAMTIRLRYMQRKTFYECQLCGCIDEIFKDHKEHIISKHPIESKTLKDPIMKELKCPVCKFKCGTQYLALCRHIVDSHEYEQYKSHLRELVHVSAFGWNASRQQEVAKTARIFQFIKRKSFFFECKLCRKVVAGYLNHVKHIKKHSKEEFDQKSIDAKKDSSAPVSSSARSTIKTPVIKTAKEKGDKLAKVLDSTNKLKQIKEQISKKDSKSCKNVKTTPIKKSQLLKKSPIVVKLKLPNTKNGKSKKSDEKEHLFKKPNTIDIRHTKNKNPKPNNKPTVSKEPLAKTKISEDKQQQVDKSNKRKRKRTKENLSIKSKLKNVTVKPAVKTIAIQNYQCSYCLKHLEGFRLFNLHLLQEHAEMEFAQCSKCCKTYLDQTLLQSHSAQCLEMVEPPAKKRRRKYVNHLGADAICKTESKITNNNNTCTKKSSGGKENEPKVPDIVKTTTKTNDYNLPDLEGEEPKWLMDLIKLKLAKKDTCSGSTDSYNHLDEDKSRTLTTNTAALVVPQLHQEVVQCCYCMHLFDADLGLNEHVKQQHSKNSEILIKFTSPQRLGKRT